MKPFTDKHRGVVVFLLFNGFPFAEFSYIHPTTISTDCIASGYLTVLFQLPNTINHFINVCIKKGMLYLACR
jgi:hypothetical protein